MDRWMWSWAFALAVGACAESDPEAGEGSGTGDTGIDAESTAADTSSDVGNCGMHVLASLDDDCEGIGTARDLLDQGAAERTAQLEWSSYASEEISHTPASGTTSVTVRLRHEGGEAVCHHFCDPCPGQPCGAASQPARIDVDAILELATEDGSLSESVDVVASTDGFSTQVAYAGSLAPENLVGTLDVQLHAADFQDLAISVSGVFTPDATSGSLAAIATHSDPTGPGITTPVATWPMP
jgi:hypothetical protein